MSKTSIRSDSTSALAGVTIVSGSPPMPAKRPSMFWLALPLILVAGCASSPTTATVAYSYPVIAAQTPLSKSQQTDQTVGRQIYELLMSDDLMNYNVTATVEDGIVTLSGPLSAVDERTRIHSLILAMPGVTDVRDRYNDYQEVRAPVDRP